MIEQSPFGQTGHLSTRLIFGGAAFWELPQAEADATLELALEYGLNHVDTAAGYRDSELRIGSWIQRHGRPFFLATKTGERTLPAAWDEFRRSLERLHVDQVDLLQLHNLVEPQEWEVALGPGGALEAALEARRQGLTRFIGVTGHGVTAPAMHRRALERFDFDSVLQPYNYVLMQNPQYAADFQALVALCRERGVAVQTIKALAWGPWGDQSPTRGTWYRPLEEQAEIDLAVHWVLGEPGIFLNTLADVHLLPRVLDAAQRFAARPSAATMQAQVARLGMQPLFV